MNNGSKTAATRVFRSFQFVRPARAVRMMASARACGKTRRPGAASVPSKGAWRHARRCQASRRLRRRRWPDADWRALAAAAQPGQLVVRERLDVERLERAESAEATEQFGRRVRLGQAKPRTVTRASSTAHTSSAAGVPTRRPSRWTSTGPNCSTSNARRVTRDSDLRAERCGPSASRRRRDQHHGARQHCICLHYDTEAFAVLLVTNPFGHLEAVHVTPLHASTPSSLRSTNTSARSKSSASSAATSAASSPCLRRRTADASSADRTASDWLNPVASSSRNARCASSSSRTEIALPIRTV